jgi:anaerobic dimethyl sulfoxide reductase subunit A
MERNDIHFGVGTPFYGYANKVIEPLGQCKTHLEIARELASHLGLADFGEETEDELLRKEVAGTEIPDYDQFKMKGVYRIESHEPYVPFKKQIEAPDNYTFDTPSGKIEIYSQTLADMNDPEIPTVPKYIDPWEGRNDPLVKKYPLQLISSHFKRRTHSQFDNVPWLRELEPQAMLMNSSDAEIRNIRDGEKVRVFNDRGEIALRVKITERIMPGVVDVPQGVWYEPDERDTGLSENPNVLINDKISPGGAFPYNTCLVDVRRFRG